MASAQKKEGLRDLFGSPPAPPSVAQMLARIDATKVSLAKAMKEADRANLKWRSEVFTYLHKLRALLEAPGDDANGPVIRLIMDHGLPFLVAQAQANAAQFSNELVSHEASVAKRGHRPMDKQIFKFLHAQIEHCEKVEERIRILQWDFDPSAQEVVAELKSSDDINRYFDGLR